MHGATACAGGTAGEGQIGVELAVGKDDVGGLSEVPAAETRRHPALPRRHAAARGVARAAQRRGVVIPGLVEEHVAHAVA